MLSISSFKTGKTPQQLRMRSRDGVGYLISDRRPSSDRVITANRIFSSLTKELSTWMALNTAKKHSWIRRPRTRTVIAIKYANIYRWKTIAHKLQQAILENLEISPPIHSPMINSKSSFLFSRILKVLPQVKIRQTLLHSETGILPIWCPTQRTMLGNSTRLVPGCSCPQNCPSLCSLLLLIGEFGVIVILNIHYIFVRDWRNTKMNMASRSPESKANWKGFKAYRQHSRVHCGRHKRKSPRFWSREWFIIFR